MDKCRKIERKKKRFAVRLKIKGIECTNVPESNIVLCNIGQATGFKKDDLSDMLQKISPSPKVVKFIAEKGDSHSFIVFDTISDAEIFMNTYDGTTLHNKSSVLVYMSFVKSVPNNELVCPSSNPKGLTIFEDFIAKEEEKALYELFDWTDESALKNRQVKHYGYEFRYGTNDVDLNNPLVNKIPQQCEMIWTRLKSHGIDIKPDQLTVNKYSPGQGIPSHVDKHSPFGDTILSLSLGSSVIMDWKHHSQQYIPVEVPPRSLLVMQGEARYDWQHSIQPRSWDPIIELRYANINNKLVKVVTSETRERQTRISLTFRTTRSGRCECVYKTLCDVSRDLDEVAASLEDLHVHQVYEQIAGHFSSTRHKPWPKVVEFLQDVPPGSIIIDLGAGNGKNILNRNDVLQIAYEYSMGLLRECASLTQAQCVRGDVLRAPLREHCADAALCIAVLHHLSTHARRVQAISTIARLLRPGGRALITVWAKDQSKSNYLCKDRENPDSDVHSTVGINLPVHKNRTQFKHNDVLVPWKLRKVKENKLENQSSETLLRYYHVFEEGELDKLCDLQDMIVEKSFYEEGNWCVICKKI